MVWIKSLFKIILLIMVSLSIVTVASPPNRKVNCRKYVFAPVCRGIAAKRLVSNEMFGDDPTVYGNENIMPLQENENQLKLDDSQGQWYINDHRRNLDTYLDDKKNYKSNADYDAMVNVQ